MAVRDRIKTTTTSTGSPFTLSTTPPTGYFAFDRFTNSDANIPVAIVQQDGAKWQVCFCTITNSGATLTVNTVVMTHNNNTTPVTFDAGTKDVFVAPIASAVAMLRENNTFTGTNTFPNTGLKVQDTDASHVLTLASGALTADRTLTLTTGSAADRTLDISAANVTISTAGAALIDDADNTAQRATLGLGAIALRPDIVNTDINANAAIAHSKLANITSGQILLGNASNVPTATAVSGDISISNTGVTAIGTNVIVNADINDTAAIAPTKLAFTQAGTGASARTVDAKIKETISVKDFGAVGNGSTNDRTAFSDAFTAASGRPVIIPAGNYNIATAYAAPAGSSAIVESGVTFTGNTPTGIDWNPWEMNLTPVVGSKMGINYKWESSPFPFENEAGIWSDKTYAGYVFSKNFDSTTNPVNGYDNGPAAALFLKADSGSASTDSIGAATSGFEGATVGILAKSVLRASNSSAWAENIIARAAENTSGQKLIGTEIDVQGTSNEFMPLGSIAAYSNSGGDLLLTHAYQDYATGTAVKLSEGLYFDKLPSSLTEWTTYYTIRNNATSSFLATTLANALANTRIAYTAPPAGGSGFGGYSVLAAKDVTFSNVSSKTLVSGIPSNWPDYTCVVFGSSGTLPDSISGSTHPFYNNYWLVKQSSTTARLATSYANAKANVTIANYTNSPSGTHHMYWQHLRVHGAIQIVGFSQPMSNAIQISGHSGGSWSNAMVLNYCDNGVVGGAGASATNKNIMNALINTGQYTTVEYKAAAILMQSGHRIGFMGTDLSASNAAKIYRDTSNDMRCVLPNAGKWRFLNAAENADNLTIDSNGRVGIGIDPTFTGAKLNVFGETQFEPSVVIRNSSNDANAAYLYFDKQKNGFGTGTLSDGDDLGTFRWRGAHLASFLDAAEIQVEADGSSNTNVLPSRIVFKTRSSTASASPAERMRINKDGYVGIGQTVISYPLDVNSNTANSNVARFTDGVAQTLTVKTDANGVLIGNDNSGYISFTSNGERVRIAADGKVGIGVTPVATLDVSGGTGNSRIRTDCSGASPTLTITNAAASAYADLVTDSNAVIIKIKGNEKFRFNDWNNFMIGGSTQQGSSQACLYIFNGTAPSAGVANGVILFSEDVSSSAELKVRDEAGNATTLSPHNFSLCGGASEEMAWAFYSERNGKRINVDMLKLARLVEKVSGEKLVYIDADGTD